MCSQFPIRTAQKAKHCFSPFRSFTRAHLAKPSICFGSAASPKHRKNNGTFPIFRGQFGQPPPTRNRKPSPRGAFQNRVASTSSLSTAGTIVSVITFKIIGQNYSESCFNKNYFVAGFRDFKQSKTASQCLNSTVCCAQDQKASELLIQMIQCVQPDRRKVSICHSGNASQNCRLQTKPHSQAIHFLDRPEFNDGCKWAGFLQYHRD
jgi:hypothetical protein